MRLAPSLLSANFSNLERDIRTLEASGIDILHVDVMDGHFVPNITIGPLVVEAIRKTTDLELDVHLMISEPGRYIDAFASAGADYLTVHCETDPHLHRTLHGIREKGVKAGVSVNPGTSLHMVEEVLPMLDLLLIMSVNPGFGGQGFIEASLDKISKAAAMRKAAGAGFAIEVDGGIKDTNAARVVQAGADILVAGSAVFRENRIEANVKRFLDVFGQVNRR